jgi:DNA-binding transcriptional ArsR family regulator
MEKNEISVHEARLFSVLRGLGREWITSAEAAKAAEISPRTSRAHLLKLADMGIVEAAAVFPGHRYRLAAKADKRNGGYLRRLEFACEIFGINHKEK